jgi:hypothetical protein
VPLSGQPGMVTNPVVSAPEKARGGWFEGAKEEGEHGDSVRHIDRSIGLPVQQREVAGIR